MIAVQKLFIAFCTLVVTSTSSSSSPLSSVGMKEDAYLTIAPGGTQVKAVGSRLILTCALIAPPNSPNASLGDFFDMKWRGPDSHYITNSKGRVYTERLDEGRLRLYITEVTEEDSGSYSCESIVRGTILTEHNELHLFEDIRFQNGSSGEVRESIGSDVILECVAEGRPEPEISWRFRGRKLTSDENGDKYVYEKNGLRIHGITRDDNGIYECRAQVTTQGNLKVRHISLNVLYPPAWISPVKSPLAIRGSDVTLECLAEGNPPVMYHWFKEQHTSTGLREEPLQVEGDDDKGDLLKTRDHAGKFEIRAIDVSDQGRYICRTSNELGTLKAVFDIKVIVAPVITAPKQLPVLEGKSIVLPCEAAGIPLPSLTWMRKADSTVSEGFTFKNDKDISVNTTADGISRLIIRNADRKRHSGNYTCTANNSAGFDSKDVDVIVETLPLASISAVELIGWKGERRQVTCLANGLPLPTIAWLHNGKHVTFNRMARLTTIRDAENVTSILEIELTDDQDLLFGNYSCVAKNIHGHTTKVFQLRRAAAPDSPRNVTVTSSTFNAISLSVETAASSVPDPAVLPLTKWVLKYQRTSDDVSSEEKINLLYEEGSNIVVENLDSNTVYTMFLSAANAAGISPSVKFQAKTLPVPGSNDVAYKYPAHEEDSGDIQGDDSRSGENAFGGESIPMDRDIILEQSILADWDGIPRRLLIGIAVALVILVVTVSGAIVRTQRSLTARRAVMTVVKTKGNTENGGATATIKVSECKDIDNVKVETNRPKTAVGPIPGDRFGSLGSKKNVRVTTQGVAGSGASTITSSASPVMSTRSAGMVVSPELGTPRGVGHADGITSAQSQAWQNMLLKAEEDARDEETVANDFPHPPLEMLLHSGRDLEAVEGHTEAEEDEDDEEVVGTKNDEMSEEVMSVNSDEECFQKAPQFEGKSFLQY